MTSSVFGKPDFRDDADAISRDALQEIGVPATNADLTSANLSLCIRAPGDSAAKYKRLKHTIVVQLILTFAAIGLGAISIFCSFQLSSERSHDLVFAVGIALLAGGWAALCAAVNI